MKRNLRKLVAGLSACAMLCCMAEVFLKEQYRAFAYEVPEETWIITRTGNWSDNLTWTYVYDLREVTNITGILTISGEGELTGEPTYYQYSEASSIQINEFDSYIRKSATKVILEAGITSIDENAFSGFTNMKEIEIPDTVTTIGANAFSGTEYALYFCDNLTSVTIPDSVTSIGENAFGKCKSLESVTLSKNLKTISDNMFKNCTALTSVVIPDGVTSIGESAFQECTSLASVQLPQKLKTIGNHAFYKCEALESVSIPDGTETLGDMAFNSCKALTEVTIPESVTTFGSKVFSGTVFEKNIRKVSPFIVNDVFLGFKNETFFPYAIPDGVTALAGGSLDANTKVTHGEFEWKTGKVDQVFVIPESVTQIAEDTFWTDHTEQFKTNITLYGVPGSYVETWAEAHETPFKDIAELKTVYKTLDGDVNGDGKVTVLDVVLLHKWLTGKADVSLINWQNANIYEDYKVNIYDFCLLKRILLKK